MTANDLLVGFVSAHGLGAVKVRVDTRINLVEHVALVGTSSVVSGSRAAGEATDTAADTSSSGAAVATSEEVSRLLEC